VPSIPSQKAKADRLHDSVGAVWKGRVDRRGQLGLPALVDPVALETPTSDCTDVDHPPADIVDEGEPVMLVGNLLHCRQLLG
jgi:hypothetical protein